jgi:transcriptional regulator with XRE-family HTH domain
MDKFGTTLKSLRLKSGLLLRQVAAATEVDTSMISKFEKGGRFPTKEQVEKLAILFHLSEKELLVHAFSEKLIADLSNEPLAQEILEQSIEKLKTKNKV